MAIVSTDITFPLSGGSGNSDPNLALGGAVSTTVWAGGTLHDLFDIITGDENAASTVDYRCVYVKNTHGSLTWEAVKLWISAETAGGASISIGLDPAGVNSVGTTIANENAAPSGVTFTAPTTKGTGLSIGNIPAGQYQAIWIRRTAANSSAIDNDGATLTAEGDTAA